MASPDYEYKGLMAQAWDLLRGDTSRWEDRFFYLEAIRRYGQPVLDVGCGTGRLLLDYLAQGIDIDGVDNSPEMLRLCRAKAEQLGLRPTLYEQQMETLALPRAYRTILIPSSSLQLVIDETLVGQALKRFVEHLASDGAIVAPFMTLWQAGDPFETESERTAVRPEDGATIRRVARARYDPEIECEHTEDIYQVLVEGRVVEEEHHQRSPATRSYSQDQARSLFQRAGLSDVQIYSGFTFEPATSRDTLFSVVGRHTVS